MVQGECGSVQVQDKPFFRPGLRGPVLCVLFAAALGLRLYRIDSPPCDFHATRQLRSALIARAYYYETAPEIPAWRRDVALSAEKSVTALEPPVMEHLAALAYRALGKESLWFPRTLSSVLWLAGGVFLYLIAARITSGDAAVFSTGFYLFLPYAVGASRSFQPDPLMVALSIAAIWAIVRYHDEPSKTRLAVAAAISALAVFIKVMAVLPLFAAFAGVAIWKHGVRKALINAGMVMFILSIAVPAGVYYGYGLFIAGFLRDQAAFSLVPRLFLKPFFWGRWLYQVVSVLGTGALLGAVVGLPLSRKGLPRALLIGLWTGYFAYGLVFNYHIHTHDYYQLPLIPIVALSLAPLFVAVLRVVSRAEDRWLARLAIWGTVVAAIGASGVVVYKQFMENVPVYENEVGTLRRIGELVHHSKKVICLGPGHGLPLLYYAEVSGIQWPDPVLLRISRENGKEIPTTQRLENMLSQISPDYFVITDFVELRKQSKLKDLLDHQFPLTELKDLLVRQYPLAAQGDDFLIFDLRKKRAE